LHQTLQGQTIKRETQTAPGQSELEELTRGYCAVAAVPSSRDRRRRRRRGGRRSVVAPRVLNGGGREQEGDGARARGLEGRRGIGGGGEAGNGSSSLLASASTAAVGANGSRARDSILERRGTR